MNITDQYMAGFVDGEGYLGIMKLNNNKVKRGYYFTPVIKIAQRAKERKVLDMICDEYGGHMDNVRIHRGNRNPSIMWSLKSNKQMITFLKRVKPYLITKRLQADILDEYIKIGKITTRNPEKLVKQRDNIYKQRACLYAKILKLNKRGIGPAETK